VPADVKSYTSCIAAFELNQQWQPLMRVFARMRSGGVVPDAAAYSVGVKAFFQMDRRHQAGSLYHEASSLFLGDANKLRWPSWRLGGSDRWILDFHGATKEVAVISLEEAFKDIVTQPESRYYHPVGDDLCLDPGRGLHSHQGLPIVRPALLTYLASRKLEVKELGPPQDLLVVPSSGLLAMPACEKEKTWLIRLGSPSMPKGEATLFQDALNEGIVAEPVRKALAAHNHDCKLASGATVLRYPEQYPSVKKALEKMETHPFHVAVSESCEYLLDMILFSIPYNKRPREKTRDCLADSGEEQSEAELAGSSEECARREASSEGQRNYVLRTERTFLSYAPVPRDRTQGCQSTTNALIESELDFESQHHFAHARGPNPRCVQADL